MKKLMYGEVKCIFPNLTASEWQNKNADLSLNDVKAYVLIT